ncbi:MAG: FISUMP domain-containing protein [Bacteroidales bacterium]|nr:FISUMP domain-containing protein [Bacteroidales bacterium]
MDFTNKTINGFTLHHKLGEGGMAEVWLAENRIKKKAAVKILKEEFEKMKPVIDRFENEATIMVQLVHPNIRQVYDYGTIEGRPSIIMEYLEGADLSARLKRGERFSSEDLKKWWNQIAAALNYTHSKEVVHRDIKPSNIFFCDDGQIKLLDFGIAKIRSSITMTQTGSRMGTLMYMSPEQIKDSKHLDYRTDLYSLAVSFVHLLTGQAPYDHTNSSEFEIQMKIVSEPVQTDKLPSDWQSFLLPYLSKEPAQRPALTSFEHKKPVQAQTTPGLPSQSKAEETIIDTGTPYFKASEEQKGKNKDEKCPEENEATIVDTEDKPKRTEQKDKIVKEQKPTKKKKSYAALWVLGIIAILVFVFFIFQGYFKQATLAFENNYITSAFVSIESTSGITHNAAKVNCKVCSDGGGIVHRRGVCYNYTGSPTINDSNITTGDGKGNFSAELKDLTENTLYFVKAFVENEKGVSYSDEVSFTTALSDQTQEWIRDSIIYATQEAQNRRAIKNTPVPRNNTSVSTNTTSLTTGTFTDSRNGKTYKTVRIGTQTWMAENLNFSTGNSWCYDNNTSNCNIYGRLYDWNTALSACPIGWHLPSDAEWSTLTNFVGIDAGKKLKSKLGWSSHGNESGTDIFGFTALSGGYYSGSFSGIANAGFWWSSAEYYQTAADGRTIGSSNSVLGRCRAVKDRGYSVRCVRDF